MFFVSVETTLKMQFRAFESKDVSLDGGLLFLQTNIRWKAFKGQCDGREMKIFQELA
jgi:hypothetical protein